ncbi:MAG: DUF6644 family protein [Caulobacteraceae bacterium]
MAVPALFKALQASPLGSTISQSTWMFPTIETVHVVAIATVIGTIFVVDLRLLCVASQKRPASAVIGEFLPWTWAAFALALVSGTLLFTSRAADYMALPAFLAKFAIMAVAAANMLVFHLTAERRITTWDTGRPITGARLAGGLSLLLWTAIVICGRQVGFSL